MITRRRIWLRYPAAAAVILAVGSLLSGSSLPTSPPLPYAYLTDTEVVVMQGDRVVGRAPVHYDVSHGDLITTTDGNYFAVLSGPAASSGTEPTLQLVAISSTTGQVQTRDCPACVSLAPVGGSRVIVNTSQGILRFDLSSAKLPVRFNPGQEQQLPDRLHLLSGTEGKAFAAARDPGNSFMEAFYVLLADGTPRKLATEERPEAHAIGQAYGQKYGLGRSAATTLPSGKARFAVSLVATRSDLDCAEDGHVSIFSSEGRMEVDTDLDPANQAHIFPGVDGALVALDLWWDSAGDLHSTILNDTCGANNAGELTSSISEWRFHDGRWLHVSNEQASAVRQLNDRSKIILQPHTAGSPSGQNDDLYLVQSSSKEKIAEGIGKLTTVDTFATPLEDPCRVDPNSCPKPALDARRLYSAPVPSLCEHPAGTLVNGSLPGLAENQGFVTLRAKDNPQNLTGALAVGDVTGDGRDETAAVFDCSQGGVAWPETIVLYSPDVHILGAVDLGNVAPSEHADVERITIRNGNILLTLITSEGAGFCAKKWSARLHWDGQSMTVQDLTEAKNVASKDPAC